MGSSDLSKVVAIYTDGGVCGKNPSHIGGTWAWCGADLEGNRIVEASGAIPAPVGHPITNNHTEQIAIALALEAMPDGWSGTVYSDSEVALGRAFKSWRIRNLPHNVIERTAEAVARLGTIEPVLLQGHPTKADLECGIGARRNLPVSIHNVWCDKACQKAKEKLFARETNEAD